VTTITPEKPIAHYTMDSVLRNVLAALDHTTPIVPPVSATQLVVTKAVLVTMDGAETTARNGSENAHVNASAAILTRSVKVAVSITLSGAKMMTSVYVRQTGRQTAARHTQDNVHQLVQLETPALVAQAQRAVTNVSSMHIVTHVENAYVMNTGVLLIAHATRDHATVAVLEPALDQTTTTVMTVKITHVMSTDSVSVKTSGVMTAVPNIPVLVTASVTHVSDQLKQTVMLVHSIPLVSFPLNNVLATRTGQLMHAVEYSAEHAHQLVNVSAEIQLMIVSTSMHMIVSSA